MRRASVIGCLLALATAASAGAPDADEIIAKHIEARGGREKLRALRSLKLTGKVTMERGDGATQMSYVLMRERPGRLRVERTMQGLTALTALDGDEGWSLRPFGGRREPDRLAPDQVKSLKVAADLDGPLVDHERKGHAVEYLGTEDVDGTEAHKLKVTLASGDVEVHYLDPDYFLTIRVVSQEKRRGVEVESETDYGNYETVEGVYIPFAWETGDKGEPKGWKVTIEKAEANVPLDDALFRFPAAPAGEVR